EWTPETQKPPSRETERFLGRWAWKPRPASRNQALAALFLAFWRRESLREARPLGMAPFLAALARAEAASEITPTAALASLRMASRAFWVAVFTAERLPRLRSRRLMFWRLRFSADLWFAMNAYSSSSNFDGAQGSSSSPSSLSFSLYSSQ